MTTKIRLTVRKLGASTYHVKILSCHYQLLNWNAPLKTQNNSLKRSKGISAPMTICYCYYLKEIFEFAL